MLLKYPRTPHLEGSRLQPGDHDLVSVPFADLAGRFLVVEEKLDGANSAISFDAGAIPAFCAGRPKETSRIVPSSFTFSPIE